MTKSLRIVVAALLLTLASVTVNAQVVGGAVFGGGRMANVGGSTLVTVIKCDTIGAVYGGNDIAGTVALDESPLPNDSAFVGAQVVIGSADNNDVHVGSVYGGGNGYYSYLTGSNTQYLDGSGKHIPVTTDDIKTGSTIATYNSPYDAVVSDVVAGLKVPQTLKTRVSLHSNKSYVDSLFGGAKNAFITTTGVHGSVTSTEVNIYGGTIYSVFGGNNYGGTIGEGSAQLVSVYATSTDNTSANLGGDVFGHAYNGHGIRYLFGGGNAVQSQYVRVNIKGGQIDTLFAGGNSADVAAGDATHPGTQVTVDVTSPLYTLATSPYTDATTYAYHPVNSVFDIRCLFGGNNAADMSGVPELTLTKGGVHNVYGGGNKGIMNGSMSYTDNYTIESFTPSNTTHHGANATRSTKVVVNSADFIADTIYGGGQSAGTLHDTYVEIAAGNVGVVYGGTNIQGRIGPESGALPFRDMAKTNVYIHGGVVHNTVFGASNGLYRCHNGINYVSGSNTLFADPNAYSHLAGQPTPSVFNSYVYITSGASVHGNVYSSGNMAVVGKPAGISGTLDQAGLAILHIDGGTFGEGTASGEITRTSNIYGGGNMGCVFGGTSLVISGSPVIYGNVYGGNDKTGRVFSPLRDVAEVLEVAHTSSPAAISALKSDYDGLPVNLTEGSGIPLNDNNAAAYALITGTPKIWGTVYGGGNGDYTYYDSYSDYLSDPNRPEPEKAVTRCAAPPDASQRSSFVDINIADAGYIGCVFGGGNSKTSGHAFRGSDNSIEEKGNVYVYMNCTGSDPASNAENIQVGTIFGGNNHVAMDVVPRIVMLKGKVGNVYGGGNMGDMEGQEIIESLALSTYVATISDKVVVAKNIYGGCNVADVSNDTYVEISRGTILGHTFGGNDLSGEVGVSHVLINGPDDANLTITGNVYGGGNGDYALYTQQRDANGAYYTMSDLSTVYANTVPSAANGAVDGVEGKYCAEGFSYFDLKGRPYVDSTAVVLNGKFTMNGNVYGGGISGDCRKTNVLVDAADGVVNGMIFGAGRGRVDNMGLLIGSSVSGSSCKELYIGVAQDADNDGVTDRTGGNINYGTATTMGNVLDTAWLTVRQFKLMGGRSAMFGGGQSGRVGTTVVNYENTVVNHLKALYLGCLASNVTNAATGIINANQDDLVDAIIDTIYGGNDFTGRVERTEMTINSGVFVHVFGGGNGDYDYKQWLTDRIGTDDDPGILHDDRTLLEAGCVDTVPYTMTVNIDINNGHFLNTVYGGGNMGLVGDRDMLAGNMDADDDGRDAYIGRITLNVHNGEFHRHIFTGARGKTDMEGKRFFALSGNNVNGQPLGKQLAYAQKIFNMDGGHVAFSVYGGSEAVDDGFPYECVDKQLSQTTLRPSSILNITGGRIEKSVYGGGYQGNIYGSVYVNVGIDAVRDSKVWTKNYGPAGHTFSLAGYKPNLKDHSGYDISTVYNSELNTIVKTRVPKEYTNIAGRTTLQKDIINCEASIYNASDWGEAGTNAYFNTRGVFGGETNILIDGKGYYTSLTNRIEVDLPSFNISNSIIGAGTSTEGGDVNRLITIRHFGDYSCPDPSKTLYSIQRADKVVLDSVFIDMLGEQDAYSAYTSPSYSFCRIDTLLFRIDNIVAIESPAIYIGNIASMKTDETVNINDPNQIFGKDAVEQEVSTPSDGTNPAVYSEVPNDFFDNLSGGDSEHPCSDDVCQNLDICIKLPNERGTAGSILATNVLMMRNGSYVKVYPFVDERNNSTSAPDPDGLDDAGHNYGHVYGWMYLLAQDATKSYVYADYKDQGGSVNPNDGGFVAPCYCDNSMGEYPFEIDYANVDLGSSGYTVDDYRTWTVGFNQGSRVRHITLVANAVPDGRLNHPMTANNYPVYVGSSSSGSTGTIAIDNSQGYAYATTYLELPPADGGNFYVINSVRIDQDNGGQMNLVDQGYDASKNYFVQSDNAITLDLDNISSDPDYTFGLTFSSGANFAPEGECWNGTSLLPYVQTTEFDRNLVDGEGTRYPCWEHTVISGNQHITSSGGYISNAIASAVKGSIPTLNFTLTYNKNLHSTITRDVIFTMHEFTSTGEYIGPVEITVTISTVISDFADLEAPVLAMFNEGITNEYVRKVTIPASYQQRDVYVTGIEWIKDDNVQYDCDTNVPPNCTTVYSDPLKKSWFNMAEYSGSPVESNTIFSVIVKPTESTSENINNTLGWYHIADTAGVDVYKAAKEDYEATTGLPFRTDANNNRTDSVYRSWNYDGNGAVTNMGAGGDYGKGLWLGTLDGRSTASIDVALKFNGMYYYHDQFAPPLAWVRLKCRYYSTKSDDKGDFYINVRVRTRLQGDTIYMAPEPTLTRTAKVGDETSVPLTMHAYGYGWDPETQTYQDGAPSSEPNFSSITTESEKTKIKNNPDCYLQDFRQVMRIYDEGDVIDIMETIPITSGTEPISVMGDDYSTIQIIRYSGSHYKFPTLSCAHYGPLVEVYGSGFLTMRNVWFNGSGCTRTKGDTTTVADPSAYTDGGRHTLVGSNHRFYEKHRRVNTLLYADAPIVYCHGNGNVSFTKRVIMSNNLSKADNSDAEFIGGGAIALCRLPSETTGAKPRVLLGDLCHLYDNVVVDLDAADRAAGGDGTDDWLPHNYGGGIYVDGGELVLGAGATGAELHIERNFYLKNMSNSAGIQQRTAHVFADDSETSLVESTFQVYYLDTLKHSSNFALSNVYLTRDPKVCDNTVDGSDNPTSLTRIDTRSDVIYFLCEMNPDSRVGVSKWFPGYVYENSRTTGENFKNDETPRDTIAIARIGKGKSNTSMVDNNYNAHIFFNDSAFYAIDNRVGVVTHPAPTPSFALTDNNGVSYSRDATNFPDYNDRVFIFRHTSLDQYNIYFQRCASFGKGVTQQLETGSCFTEGVPTGTQFNSYIKGDSISYHWMKDATCALAMDTLHFRVGGGFFPYTYQWYDISDTVSSLLDPDVDSVVFKPLHSRTTRGSNAISRFGNDEYEELRLKAEYDTLVFRMEVGRSQERYNYAFQVVATDLTGNCPVTQDVKVRAVKVATDHHDDGEFFYDYADFLLHRQHGALTNTDTASARADERFYRVAVPGVDSSSFHDHALVDATGKVIGGIPQHHEGTDADHPERGGIRRASYTHHVGEHNNPLTAEDFDGLPWAEDGSGNVGDMTPRYLRLFRSYRVKPSIYPVAARGEIAISDVTDTPLATISSSQMSNDKWHPDFEVCPGEVLHLNPTAATSSWEFIGWDFDPSSPANATFVVGNDVASNKPIIYYVPGDYWWQVVTSQPAGYEVDYYGNVTISSKEGLAWLISTVNGYNNQNAQTFHFNTITLNNTEPLDMSAHKWTPLGNVNNPFEGVFDGNGKHITNILVNETTVPLVGMFGHTDGATIKNFTIDSTMVRGNTYVSAVVGEATNNTLVQGITIQRGAIFGEYCIGGFISNMVNSTLENCRLYTEGVEIGPGSGTIGAFGNAIYGGGFVGLASGSTLINNSFENTGYIDISKLSVLYVGAMIGYNKDIGQPVNQKSAGKSVNKTILNNNYARIVSSSKAQRLGGLVGYAEDIDINNNYVYGIAEHDKANGFAGGLLGYVGDNVSISNSYFIDGMTNNAVGYNNGTASMAKTASFHGKGNSVILSRPVDGYTNLTRSLNAWVRDHDTAGVYRTWRSDLEGENSGYPVFGTPDIIPVSDTLQTTTCDSYEIDGLTLYESGVYLFHVVDSSDFVDSTLTLMLTVNYGDTTRISDTADIANGYEGNGFSLSADQLRSAYVLSRENDVAMLQFIDSLQNANGCDSLVVLTLYVTGTTAAPEVQRLVDVKVYPNPTRGIVNVEGSDLQSVEVYDNVSRRVLSRSVDGDNTSFDLSNQPSGSYYLRVVTAHGTVVKKLIKK